MAKRHLNAINGNIVAYCRVLNSEDHHLQVTEVNEIAAVLAEIEEDEENEKEKNAQKTEATARDKELKWAAEQEAERRKKTAAMPAVTEAIGNIIQQGIVVVAPMTVDLSKSILKYYFGQDGKGWSKLKKPDFVKLVEGLWNVEEMLSIAA